MADGHKTINYIPLAIRTRGRSRYKPVFARILMCPWAGYVAAELAQQTVE